MKKILLVITATLSMFFISEPVTADIGLYSYQTNNPDYDDYVSENILSFINNWDTSVLFSDYYVGQANWNYGYIYSFN